MASLVPLSGLMDCFVYLRPRAAKWMARRARAKAKKEEAKKKANGASFASPEQSQPQISETPSFMRWLTSRVLHPKHQDDKSHDLDPELSRNVSAGQLKSADKDVETAISSRPHQMAGVETDEGKELRHSQQTASKRDLSHDYTEVGMKSSCEKSFDDDEGPSQSRCFEFTESDDEDVEMGVSDSSDASSDEEDLTEENPALLRKVCHQAWSGPA